MRDELIILGRGIAGLTCAYAFLKQGFSNIKIIGEIAPPGSASWAAQGVLSSKGLVYADQDLFSHKLISQHRTWEWLRTLEKDSDMKISWKKSGVWEVFFDELDREKTLSRIYKREFFGFSGAQPYDWKNAKQNGLASNASWFTKVPDSLFFYPSDGFLDPQSVLMALERFLLKQGVHMVEDHVLSVETLDDSFLLKTKGNPQVYKTKNLLLALGSFLPSFSKSLLQRFGVVDSYKFVYGQIYEKPIDPIKKEFEDECVLVKGLNSIVSQKTKHSFGVYSSKHESLEQACLLNHLQEQNKLISHLNKQFFLDTNLFNLSPPTWGVRLLNHRREPIAAWYEDRDFSNSCRLGICSALYKSGYQLAAWIGDTMVEKFIKFNSR